MQNAMDIMAMVQKATLAKPKLDVPSKPLGVGKASFRKELLQARKELPKNEQRDSKAADANTSRTTEKKAQKLAKVMSNSNAKAEVKNDDSVDSMEQQSVKELNAQAEKVVDSTTVKPEETNSVSKSEDQIKLEETADSVIEMLQQLLQQMQNPAAEGKLENKPGETIAMIQSASQKLEQLLTSSKLNSTKEIGELLKSMQSELAKLLEQLPTTASQQNASPQMAQLMHELIKKLDVQVGQLQQKLQQTDMPIDLKVLQPEATNKVVVRETNTGVNADVSKTGAVTAKTEQQPVEANTNKRSDRDESGKDKSNEKRAASNMAEAVKPKLVVTTDNADTESLKNLAALQNEKPNFQVIVKELNSNLQKTNLVNITKADFVNQIVKKADIVLREGHQEMVMKLEPESLGKLNLKIIMENGQITAKFVAESQQVKEVLESSFNQLKDALQEKGVNVQSFSVSVGQEGADFQSQQGLNQWKNAIKVNSKLSKDYLELEDDMMANNNPYNYHEGKVDFRA